MNRSRKKYNRRETKRVGSQMERKDNAWQKEKYEEKCTNSMAKR